MGKTQHRPKRDTATAKEMADLKQENRTLKNQLARTRKQLIKVLETHGRRETEAQEEVEIVKLPRGNECEKCGSSKVVHLQIPTGTLIACKDCKSKRIQK